MHSCTSVMSSLAYGVSRSKYLMVSGHGCMSSSPTKMGMHFENNLNTGCMHIRKWTHKCVEIFVSLHTILPTLRLCGKKVMVSAGGCGCGSARSHLAYARGEVGLGG